MSATKFVNVFMYFKNGRQCGPSTHFISGLWQAKEFLGAKSIYVTELNNFCCCPAWGIILFWHVIRFVIFFRKKAPCRVFSSAGNLIELLFQISSCISFTRVLLQQSLWSTCSWVWIGLCPLPQLLLGLLRWKLTAMMEQILAAITKLPLG